MNGRAARRLIFRSGKIQTRGGPGPEPEYEVTFIDMPNMVRKMIQEPNNVLWRMAENKIIPSGNNYYLLQFGYLSGLCERYIRDLSARFRPRDQEAKNDGCA